MEYRIIENDDGTYRIESYYLNVPTYYHRLGWCDDEGTAKRCLTLFNSRNPKAAYALLEAYDN